MAISTLVFDVNETLSDTGVLERHFAAAGAPPELAKTWFTAVLRDGFALATTGANASFPGIARDLLATLLAVHGLGDVEGATEKVLAGFLDLPVHDDVAAGVRELRAAGFRLVTLTNGSVDITQRLLDRAGVRDRFDSLLSVAQAPAWKPAASAYRYALGVCNLTPDEAMLVSVHPWDIHGAATAGLATAWLDRDGTRYPKHFRSPSLTVASLGELARSISTT